MASFLPYLVLFTLAIGTGLLLGGSLRRFEDLRIHRWGLALIAAALQAPALAIAGVPASVIGPVMLSLSYALLLAFLYANRWIPGAMVMTIGLVLKLGMPFSRRPSATVLTKSSLLSTLKLSSSDGPTRPC